MAFARLIASRAFGVFLEMRNPPGPFLPVPKSLLSSTDGRPPLVGDVLPMRFLIEGEPRAGQTGDVIAFGSEYVVGVGLMGAESKSTCVGAKGGTLWDDGWKVVVGGY